MVSPPFPRGVWRGRPNPAGSFVGELEKINMSIPEQDVISKVPTDGVPEVFGIVFGAVGVPCPVALYDFVRGTPGYLS